MLHAWRVMTYTLHMQRGPRRQLGSRLHPATCTGTHFCILHRNVSTLLHQKLDHFELVGAGSKGHDALAPVHCLHVGIGPKETARRSNGVVQLGVVLDKFFHHAEVVVGDGKMEGMLT